MAIWEEAGLSPSLLRDSMVSFIPKNNKVVNHCAAVKAFRRITVYSVWWRSWSSAWVKSEQLAPVKGISGSMGCLGGKGTMTKAHICDAILRCWKHGCSVDYSFCFDSIDLRMLRLALLYGLPQQLQSWAALITGHWISAQRGLVYDHNVSAVPLCAGTGIPQGDAGSPLALGLLLALGSQGWKKW